MKHDRSCADNDGSQWAMMDHRNDEITQINDRSDG